MNHKLNSKFKKNIIHAEIMISETYQKCFEFTIKK